MNTKDAELVRSFITNKDKDSLKQYLNKRSDHHGHEATHRWFRLQVLAYLPRPDALWFWSDGLNSKFISTINKVVRTCVGMLDKSELNEKDHWHVEKGHLSESILYASPDAKHYLLDELPCERHAILRVAMINKTKPNLHKGGTINEQCSKET